MFTFVSAVALAFSVIFAVSYSIVAACPMGFYVLLTFNNTLRKPPREHTLTGLTIIIAAVPGIFADFLGMVLGPIIGLFGRLTAIIWKTAEGVPEEDFLLEE